MSAEGNLYNVALFNGLPPSLPLLLEGEDVKPISSAPHAKAVLHPSHPAHPSHPSYWSDEQILKRHPPAADVALDYIKIVKGLKTKTVVSAVKGHLFKILRPALGREIDLRDRLGRARVGERPKGYWGEDGEGTKRAAGTWVDGEEGGWLEEYVKVCEEMKVRLDVRVFTLSLCWALF